MLTKTETIKNHNFEAKLKIIQILFEPNLADENNNLIDTNNAPRYAREHLLKLQKISKKDLIYINKTVKILTDILSLDENKITTEYVKSKLFLYHYFDDSNMMFEPSDKWITAYKELLYYLNIVNKAHESKFI